MYAKVNFVSNYYQSPFENRIPIIYYCVLCHTIIICNRPSIGVVYEYFFHFLQCFTHVIGIVEHNYTILHYGEPCSLISRSWVTISHTTDSVVWIFHRTCGLSRIPPLSRDTEVTAYFVSGWDAGVKSFFFTYIDFYLTFFLVTRYHVLWVSV